MAKNIRVNQIAKELGITSKVILDKLKKEGLGDQAKNHQSAVSLGLAATIREWFSAADSETAVEVAAPVRGEVKKQVRRQSASADASADATDDAEGGVAVMDPPADDADDADDAADAGDADDTAAGDGPDADSEATNAEIPPYTPSQTPPESPAETRPEMPATPPVLAREVPESAAAPDVLPEPAPPASPEVPAAPAVRPAASADEAPVAARTPSPRGPAGVAGTPGERVTRLAPGAQAPGVGPARLQRPGDKFMPASLQDPTMRPTITLADRQRDIQERIRKEREAKRAAEGPVAPAPQLTELKKAEIAGPKVVRIEQPDHVPAPRRPRERTDMAPRINTGPLAKGGGGVRVATEEEAAEAKKKAASGRSLSGRRRGGDGRFGEAIEKLQEFTNADQIARRDALNAARANRSLLEFQLSRSANRGKGSRAPLPSQATGAVLVHEPITVKSLSGDLGIKSGQIIRTLMKSMGALVTINHALSVEQAETIAMELGREIAIVRQPSAEERLERRFEEIEDALDDASRVFRPPVVTILGHVDHGKTSLLDKIRNANVVAGEAGGITQHVAAFDVAVERNGDSKIVTFIDTPGHQAFTAMRARGAQVTDIVVLVVDAAQGIQPQTVESINHARAAGVPIVVAMNKIDRDDANPDKVLGELAGQDLNPSEWGGETEVVRTSAMTGQGIEDLLEILDLQAELMELTAAQTTPARGRVIEARMAQGLGPVATVLVQAGTLKVGDVVLAGTGYGRVRALQKSTGQQVRLAGPSMPVLVSGFNEVPSAGDAFFVMANLGDAEAVAGERREETRREDLAVKNRVSLETLFDTVEAGKIKTINLILKGDVQGSVETLQATVGDQNTDEVRVRVIHAAVGAVSESDVELASASDAIVIGFHVGIDEQARQLSEQRGVEIRTYDVIYEIFDDLKKALSGMLEPEIREVYQGTAEVRATFRASRLGTIAGCYVTDGVIMRSSLVRLLRDGAVVAQDLSVDSLRRVKDDVREVKAGLECGLNLANYNDVKEGDKLEFYVREKVARTL